MRRNTIHTFVGIGVFAATLTVGSALAGVPQTRLPSLLIPLRADLDAAHAVPAPKVAAPAATGRLDGALVRTAREKHGEGLGIAWSLRWKLNTSGTTGPVTAAAIHVGAAGETGPVLVALCAPCSSRAGAVVRNLTSEQATALRRGNLYVNVETAANPAGEIRGQVTRRSARPPGTIVPGPLPPPKPSP